MPENDEKPKIVYSLEIYYNNSTKDLDSKIDSFDTNSFERLAIIQNLNLELNRYLGKNIDPIEDLPEDNGT